MKKFIALAAVSVALILFFGSLVLIGGWIPVLVSISATILVTFAVYGLLLLLDWAWAD